MSRELAGGAGLRKRDVPSISGVEVRGRVNAYVRRAARLQVASAGRLNFAKPFSIPLRRPQPARLFLEFNGQVYWKSGRARV